MLPSKFLHFGKIVSYCNLGFGASKFGASRDVWPNLIFATPLALRYDVCGIFGLVSATGLAEPDRRKTLESVATLSHRGPDANSIFTGPGFALGHARLALVDIDERSNQPFWDPTGRYGMVYNGEVYNFRELRAELQALGVAFRTTSDTEVVLHMLIRYPVAVALRRLDGMFGLAFFDRESRVLILARDRFGMKPVYWTERSVDGAATTLFASEIKAFRPWVALRHNSSRVYAYLLKFPGSTSGPTFFDGVNSLAPGTFLTCSPGQKPSISRFFSLDEFVDQGEIDRLDRASPVEVTDQFEALLDAAVGSHLFADAKVGAFCSGGVDSSLIVAMAARKNKDVALFHANVRGSWSELEPAQALARHLKLDLHVVDVEEQSFVDLIPRVMAHYEQPFTYHPNCPPLMMVAGLARDTGIKGLLSGEGSDELFLGYPWLGRKKITDSYDRLIGASARAIRAIPAIGKILAPDRQGDLGAVIDIASGRESADDQALTDFVLSQRPNARQDPTRQWTLDYLHLHLRTLLHRNDTMGMAAGIEARFPFLDTAVARFGVNLPGKFKLRKSPFVFEKAHPFIRDKWVVRAVSDRSMPKGLSQRIKVGFWTTTFQRMEIDNRFFAGSPLGDILGLGPERLSSTLASASHDLKLRLLHLDVWARIMLDGEDPDLSVARLQSHVTIRPQGQKAHGPAVGAKNRRAAYAQF